MQILRQNFQLLNFLYYLMQKLQIQILLNYALLKMLAHTNICHTYTFLIQYPPETHPHFSSIHTAETGIQICTLPQIKVSV